MNWIKRLLGGFSPRLHPVEPIETPSIIEPQKIFIDVLEEYIKRYVAENQLKEETAGHYDLRFRNIHLFLSSKGLTGLTLPDVKARVMEDLRSYLLINLATCSRRHASRHIDLCKNAIKYAVRQEYTSQDWINPIKGQRDKPKPIIHLTKSEVKNLVAYNFRSDIYNTVAKMFAFQCFTGLAYCELFTFKFAEINGRIWIDGARNKTEKSEYVYVFEEAIEIWEYFGHRIPKVSIQTCNRVLKEIAQLLNIDKKISTHVGRKTHATLLDEAGVTGKTIGRQLRSTDRMVEDRYISKSHLRTENELERLGLTGRLLAS